MHNPQVSIFNLSLLHMCAIHTSEVTSSKFVPDCLQAIRVFFLLRDLSLTLRQEPEYQLPLTKQEECVKVSDVLDLSQCLKSCHSGHT